jgi:hypothetical protein
VGKGLKCEGCFLRERGGMGEVFFLGMGEVFFTISERCFGQISYIYL